MDVADDLRPVTPYEFIVRLWLPRPYGDQEALVVPIGIGRVYDVQECVVLVL